ncbi:hypothetical protein AMTRI_Chr12g275170 [Amborella trichopoda]
MSDWAKQGWGMSYVREFRFYRVRGPLMTLLEWSPSMQSSVVKRDLIWVHLWGDIVNLFGEYYDVDRKLLDGLNASFVRVKINRFLGVPCPRQIRLQVFHDLFLIDVNLEGTGMPVDNPHKVHQAFLPCQIQRPEKEWIEVQRGAAKQIPTKVDQEFLIWDRGVSGSVRFYRKILNWAGKNYGRF